MATAGWVTLMFNAKQKYKKKRMVIIARWLQIGTTGRQPVTCRLVKIITSKRLSGLLVI